METDVKKNKEDYQPKKKFRTKIFKVFILISLIPLIIISISSLFIVVKTRQQNIAELQNLAIENAQEKVQKYLNDKVDKLHIVLNWEKISLVGMNDETWELPDINFDVLTDATERERAKSKARADSRNGLKILVDNIKSNLDVEVEEISFIDENGKEVVKDLDIVPVFLDVAREEYFQRAIKGEKYFGKVEFTESGNILTVASQIESKNKKIIGVIAAKINLSQLPELLNTIRLGESGLVYVVDDSGKLLASSRPELAGIGEDMRGRSWVREAIGGRTYDGLVKFETRENPAGEKIIIAAKPMKEINWFVLSEWPRTDAYSVIVNILVMTLLITLVTLVLIVFLGFVFARQVEKPLKSLRHGALHISQGDMDYRLRIKTGDEFEILGAKFNDMIKVLKENRKLRDEFVFISAHELRTPVTAIKGYLSMILDESFGKVPDKIKESLNIVNASNERLVQLVHDLLEIARSEAGKMQIDMIDTVIKENVTTVVNELKSLADKKRINVAYDEKLSGTKVKADPYKLKEVITNLVGNAIKYTLGNGGVEITHEIKDKFLVTHIKDHGIGMTPEEAEKLFGKFYRVQTDETKNIEGTGLGLFICKEIVERMGGKIWVDSAKGQGSTFSFSLQLA